MKLSALSALLAFGCLVGCSSQPGSSETGKSAEGSKSAATPLDPSMHEVTARDKSFTLAVPKDWAIADKSDPDFAAALAKNGNKDAAKSIEQVVSNPVLQLVVMDTKGVAAAKKFIDNLNVVVLPAKGAGPNEDMLAAAEGASKQLFGTSKYTTGVLETPNGKVGMYTGSTSLGSPEPHDLIGGIIIHNEKAYTITLSCEAGKAAGFEKTFKDVFNSLKFK